MVCQKTSTMLLLSPSWCSTMLLLWCGSIVEHHDGDSSSIVLVFWQTMLNRIVLGVSSVDSFQPLQHLCLGAHLPLSFVSTLEEDHVASKDLGERVPVKRSLWPVLRDPVAIHEAFRKLLGKSRVLTSNANLSNRLGVLFDVDLEVRSQQLHLGEHTSQISHLGSNALLELPEVFEEFNEIILISIKKPRACRALRSPERGKLVEVLETCQLLERIVDSSWKSGEGVVNRPKKLHQVICWCQLHAFICCFEYSNVIRHHILLAPAMTAKVVEIDLIHDLFHFFLPCLNSEEAKQRQQ